MITTITNLALLAFKNETKALEALSWYDYAGRFCAELDKDHSLPQGTTAGVVAALSPLNTWECQVKFTPGIISHAVQLLHEGKSPYHAIHLSFSSNKDKAARILCGEAPLDVLGGDKVRNFFRNLTGDWEAVTIDRHAISITGFTSKSADTGKLTSGVYSRLAFAFSSAAKSIGIAPAECQALTWCYWRNPW